MGVGVIDIYINGQSLTASSTIARLVEKSKNYLAIRLIADDSWMDCKGISIKASHESLSDDVDITKGTELSGQILFLIPPEVIKPPGFSIYVTGYTETQNAYGHDLKGTITTHPIYFKVDLTGSKVELGDSEATAISTMAAAIENSNATNIATLSNNFDTFENTTKTSITNINNTISNMSSTVTNINSTISGINSTVTNLGNELQSFKTTTNDRINGINTTTSALRKDINTIHNVTLPSINQTIVNVNDKVVTLGTEFNSFKNTTKTSITNINNTISNFKTTTSISFKTFKNEVNTAISDFKTDVNTTISNINTTINDFKTDVNATLESFSQTTNQTLSDSQSFIIDQDLISTAWIKEGDDYYQLIDNDNITNNSKVDIQLDNATFYELSNAGLVFVVKQDYYGIVNKTRETRIYSLGKKPEEDYSIQLEITKLKGVTGNPQIQGSPIGHLIDWNQNTIRNKPTTTASDDVFSVTVSNGVCQIKLNKELYYK